MQRNCKQSFREEWVVASSSGNSSRCGSGQSFLHNSLHPIQADLSNGASPVCASFALRPPDNLRSLLGIVSWALWTVQQFESTAG